MIFIFFSVNFFFRNFLSPIDLLISRKTQWIPFKQLQKNRFSLNFLFFYLDRRLRNRYGTFLLCLCGINQNVAISYGIFLNSPVYIAWTDIDFQVIFSRIVRTNIWIAPDNMNSINGAHCSFVTATRLYSYMTLTSSPPLSPSLNCLSSSLLPQFLRVCN